MTVIESRKNSDGRKLFDDVALGMTLTITGILIAYSIPIIYIIKHRKVPVVLTRSPDMIVIFLCLLMGDCILNTIIFSLDYEISAQTECKVGIICTAFFFNGAIVFYLARMYRMFKFFELYRVCLIQKALA